MTELVPQDSNESGTAQDIQVAHHAATNMNCTGLDATEADEKGLVEEDSALQVETQKPSVLFETPCEKEVKESDALLVSGLAGFSTSSLDHTQDNSNCDTDNPIDGSPQHHESEIQQREDQLCSPESDPDVVLDSHSTDGSQPSAKGDNYQGSDGPFDNNRDDASITATPASVRVPVENVTITQDSGKLDPLVALDAVDRNLVCSDAQSVQEDEGDYAKSLTSVDVKAAYLQAPDSDSLEVEDRAVSSDTEAVAQRESVKTTRDQDTPNSPYNKNKASHPTVSTSDKNKKLQAHATPYRQQVCEIGQHSLRKDEADTRYKRPHGERTDGKHLLHEEDRTGSPKVAVVNAAADAASDDESDENESGPIVDSNSGIQEGEAAEITDIGATVDGVTEEPPVRGQPSDCLDIEHIRSLPSTALGPSPDFTYVSTLPPDSDCTDDPKDLPPDSDCSVDSQDLSRLDFETTDTVHSRRFDTDGGNLAANLMEVSSQEARDALRGEAMDCTVGACKGELADNNTRANRLASCLHINAQDDMQSLNGRADSFGEAQASGRQSLENAEARMEASNCSNLRMDDVRNRSGLQADSDSLDPGNTMELMEHKSHAGSDNAQEDQKTPKTTNVASSSSEEQRHAVFGESSDVAAVQNRGPSKESMVGLDARDDLGSEVRTEKMDLLLRAVASRRGPVVGPADATGTSESLISHDEVEREPAADTSSPCGERSTRTTLFNDPLTSHLKSSQDKGTKSDRIARETSPGAHRADDKGSGEKGGFPEYQTVNGPNSVDPKKDSNISKAEEDSGKSSNVLQSKMLPSRFAVSGPAKVQDRETSIPFVEGKSDGRSTGFQRGTDGTSSCIETEDGHNCRLDSAPGRGLRSEQPRDGLALSHFEGTVASKPTEGNGSTGMKSSSREGEAREPRHAGDMHTGPSNVDTFNASHHAKDTDGSRHDPEIRARFGPEQVAVQERDQGIKRLLADCEVPRTEEGDRPIGAIDKREVDCCSATSLPSYPNGQSLASRPVTQTGPIEESSIQGDEEPVMDIKVDCREGTESRTEVPADANRDVRNAFEGDGMTAVEPMHDEATTTEKLTSDSSCAQGDSGMKEDGREVKNQVQLGQYVQSTEFHCREVQHVDFKQARPRTKSAETKVTASVSEGNNESGQASDCVGAKPNVIGKGDKKKDELVCESGRAAFSAEAVSNERGVGSVNVQKSGSGQAPSAAEAMPEVAPKVSDENDHNSGQTFARTEAIQNGTGLKNESGHCQGLESGESPVGSCRQNIQQGSQVSRSHSSDIITKCTTGTDESGRHRSLEFGQVQSVAEGARSQMAMSVPRGRSDEDHFVNKMAAATGKVADAESEAHSDYRVQTVFAGDATIASGLSPEASCNDKTRKELGEATKGQSSLILPLAAVDGNVLGGRQSTRGKGSSDTSFKLPENSNGMDAPEASDTEDTFKSQPSRGDPEHGLVSTNDKLVSHPSETKASFDRHQSDDDDSVQVVDPPSPSVLNNRISTSRSGDSEEVLLPDMVPSVSLKSAAHNVETPVWKFGEGHTGAVEPVKKRKRKKKAKSTTSESLEAPIIRPSKLSRFRWLTRSKGSATAETEAQGNRDVRSCANQSAPNHKGHGVKQPFTTHNPSISDGTPQEERSPSANTKQQVVIDINNVKDTTGGATPMGGADKKVTPPVRTMKTRSSRCPSSTSPDDDDSAPKKRSLDEAGHIGETVHSLEFMDEASGRLKTRSARKSGAFLKASDGSNAVGDVNLEFAEDGNFHLQELNGVTSEAGIGADLDAESGVQRDVHKKQSLPGIGGGGSVCSNSSQPKRRRISLRQRSHRL